MYSNTNPPDLSSHSITKSTSPSTRRQGAEPDRGHHQREEPAETETEDERERERRSAELSKLAASALLAQQMSSVNALSVLREATGIDVSSRAGHG